MRKTNETEARAAALASRFLDSRALDRRSYARTWLVEHILVGGQPAVLGGPRKSLKTTLAIDLALSLGSGTPFLDAFAVPRQCRVAVLSGESGAATVQETARRVAQAKGVGLKDCDVRWSFHLPRLSEQGDRVALREYLRSQQIEAVVLDPLYLCLFPPGQGASASNLYEVGPLLRLAGGAYLDVGATPVLVHHATKGRAKKQTQSGPPDLDDLAFAGIAEYARQWVLLARRCPYQSGTGRHQLVMAVGGSAGHSGCWEVDVEEGVADEQLVGRSCEVRVRPSGDAGAGDQDDADFD